MSHFLIIFFINAEFGVTQRIGSGYKGVFLGGPNYCHLTSTNKSCTFFINTPGHLEQLMKTTTHNMKFSQGITIGIITCTHNIVFYFL